MGYAMRKKLEELSDELKAELQAIKGHINIHKQYTYALIGLLYGGLPAALGGAGGVKVEEQTPLGGKSTTPAIYNVTMTNADTEYSQALPANCKKFSIHTRPGTAFRIAFATGKVAAPTEPYWTMNYGVAYWENDLNLTGVTVYFACDADGVDVEIIAWA